MYWVSGVAASTIPDMEKNRGSDDKGGRSLGRVMVYPAPWQHSHHLPREIGRYLEGREERRDEALAGAGRGRRVGGAS